MNNIFKIYIPRVARTEDLVKIMNANTKKFELLRLHILLTTFFLYSNNNILV